MLYVDGEKCNCIFKQSGDYVVGVTFAAATNNASNFTAMLTWQFTLELPLRLLCLWYFVC